mmetsp:Transcript_26190/g.58207  ORF Transcript_26190/g.58207 Transcript_26190/m.58207 type:complete len:310 (+) Transcript_26190:126-1055(+)
MGKKKGKKKAKKEQRAAEKAAEKAAADAVAAKLDDLFTTRVKNELDTSDLFAPPPPKEECPICFLPMIGPPDDSRYMECCGKVICFGCSMENKRIIANINAKRMAEEKQTGIKAIMMEETCAFCREPVAAGCEEMMLRAEKRMAINDPFACYHVGGCYGDGRWGRQVDGLKALDLFHRAAELGLPGAFAEIGRYYERDTVVKKDLAKFRAFFAIAAIKGSLYARDYLGTFEYRQGNTDIALRHWRLSAAAGYQDSLERLRAEVMKGKFGADEYASTLQPFLTSYGEMKSEARVRFEKQIETIANNRQGI